MSKLICDICGTSYSDGVEKCPTCGHSRAFVEQTAAETAVPVVREKVRGGRFSKKNVRKRLQMLEQAGRKHQDPTPVMELVEEMTADAVPALNVPEQTIPVSGELPAAEVSEHVQAEEATAEAAPDEVSAMLLLHDEEPEEAEEPEETPVMCLFPDEESEQAEEPEEAAEEEAPVVLLFPDEESEQAEEPEEAATEEAPVVLLFPDEEPEQAEEPEEAAAEEAPVILPLTDEESEQEENTAAAEAEENPPVVLPAEEPRAEDAEKKKKKGGCLLNVVFYTSLAVFLASVIYLLAFYGIPYLKNMDWPTQPVAETTMPTEEPTPAPTEEPTQAPTEAPTEAPTDPPTEPPTDPPTEAPTDPPTEPPTEAPTEPLLDVKLELNYYDLTFGAPNQGTQLEANIIPNEDITWISDDPSIVTISETGKIISVGGGRTTVRAIYGDQEVTVKINCAF